MRAAALLLLAVAACSDDAPPGACSIGDASLPIELELVARGDSPDVMEVDTPMTAVPLVVPPQGGLVLFVAARARNLDNCAVMLTASLRDPCSNEVVTVERRPVLLESTGDGWAGPDVDALSQWSNLPVCPSSAATRDLQGQHYLLRVALEASDGRTAEATMMVVPTCAADDLTCLCQCQAGYELGSECPTGLEPGTPTECPAE